MRLSVIGRQDRIRVPSERSIAQVEEHERGPSLHLRVAMDYSARERCWRRPAVSRGHPRPARRSSDHFVKPSHAPSGARDVDLLIRTGGEQRLSDFLLWGRPTPELYFTDVLWPEFTGADLAAAVQAFRS